MEERSAKRKGKNSRGISTLPRISRSKINEPTFRILLTGPEKVIPDLATRMKKCLSDKYSIGNSAVHYAVTLHENIVLRLRDNGVHGIVLCADTSKSTTISSIRETLKHLDFDLISTSLYILNLVQPSPTVCASVADEIEKLSIAYNTPIVNIHLKDEKSVQFGLDRLSTAALRGAKFIYGYESPSLLNVDFLQLGGSFD